MKISKIALIFWLVYMPFLFIYNSQDKIAVKEQEQVRSYNRYINTALKDATTALLRYSAFDYVGNSVNITINTEETINTFIRSMSLQISQKESLQDVIPLYIPAIVIIDSDGFYVYASEEIMDDAGYTYYKHVIYPKQYFAYKYKNQVINFHLDNYIKIINETGLIFEGNITEVTTETDIFTSIDYEVLKKEVIISAIEENLEHYINRHNLLAKNYGMQFTFNMTRLSGDDWNNVIKDIGMIVFVQGLPTYEGYYSKYALNTSRMLQGKKYIAYESSGYSYYCIEDCDVYKGKTVEKVFCNKADAVAEGYYPCEKCR